MPRIRIALSSELRDRVRFPQANAFQVPHPLQEVTAVSMVAYHVSPVQAYALTEENNFMVYSEDFLVYSRATELPAEERLRRKVIRVPAGSYGSLEAILGLLEEQLVKTADAVVFFTYDTLRCRYTLRSTMLARDGTLRAFHVFASPILELFGFEGHRNHLLTGGRPYVVRKAENFIQGLPRPGPRGSTVVIATLLADGVIHSELATITAEVEGGIEVAERLRFSDYLLSVHTGVIQAACAPRTLPIGDEPVLLLRLAPFNLCRTAAGVPYFASLNSRVMGFHTLQLPAPLSATHLEVEVTDVHGRPADVRMGEVFVELDLEVGG